MSRNSFCIFPFQKPQTSCLSRTSVSKEFRTVLVHWGTDKFKAVYNFVCRKIWGLNWFTLDKKHGLRWLSANGRVFCGKCVVLGLSWEFTQMPQISMSQPAAISGSGTHIFIFPSYNPKIDLHKQVNTNFWQRAFWKLKDFGQLSGRNRAKVQQVIHSYRLLSKISAFGTEITTQMPCIFFFSRSILVLAVLFTVVVTFLGQPKNQRFYTPTHQTMMPTRAIWMELEVGWWVFGERESKSDVTQLWRHNYRVFTQWPNDTLLTVKFGDAFFRWKHLITVKFVAVLIAQRGTDIYSHTRLIQTSFCDRE